MIPRWSVFCLFVAMAAGCGADRPQLAPVTGTVSLDGKPLESGMIVLTPAKGRAAVGKVVSGEIVEVSTFDPKDGAPVGRLVVTVMDTPPTGMVESKEKIVPSKYNSAETSEITAAVYAGKPNTVTIELVTEAAKN